ncbi:MAG: ferredoxin III, nif-specific [Magnetococcales bacterium]|nr:ferredoxin III, nif-specific [Magnetococcales bacterium]
MNGQLVTGVTRGGSLWIPNFIVSLDGKRCIGCGRCFKVCPRTVFDLVDRDSVQGQDADEDWQEDEFSDDPHMVMIIQEVNDCVGCAACSRVCPKRCHSHAPMPINP